MKTPESELKQAVQKMLAKLKIRFFRMNSGKVKVKGGWMQLHPTGTADFLVVTAGNVPLWIELKAPGQATAKERKLAQEAFAEEMRALGHQCHRCESVDEVKAVVEAVKEAK